MTRGAIDEEAVRALLREGLTIREVVRRTGAGYTYVRTLAHQMGRPGSRSHPNAPGHPWRNAVDIFKGSRPPQEDQTP
jgi:transposase